ncbi:DUF6498-containing protein [Nocardioides lacusdianchii]|uniref:DUF6498-containing protein n=1 Tax=Nocardioides lacusdianchii TaxID=2783664 RepID=UPI001CCC8136|nr:DUF6498-containing protein [Nocardioides lacusdianchii]
MSTGEQGPPRAPLLSAVSLVVGNLLPVWAVWAGHMSVGDVFVVYWLENVAVWAITIVKVRTARGVPGRAASSWKLNGRPVDPDDPRPLAFFFALHYGIFTFVHGVFAFVMAFLAGGELHPASWLLAGVALGLSHLASLWINWYDGGERLVVSAQRAMWLPYPRMLVLHVGILVGFGLVMGTVAPGGSPGGVREVAPVLVLLGLKTVVDLGLHLWERSRAGAGAAAATG